MIEEGLVFGYDTGFPAVSGGLDSYRFNLGEPTTNKLNSNILGTGNGASLGSDSFGDYIQLANKTSSYSRFQIPNITVTSNETYTWNFELYSGDTVTKSGNYYFDTNEYSDQFPSSNDLSRLSSTNSCPSTMSANEWTPFRLTVTMKDNLTGAYSYDFFNMLYPGFQNKKIYYRNMQFETKSHKTPYAGQAGVRSVSGSLLDLKGKTDINLTNVSFDSNAQIVFDGTDDHFTTSGLSVGTPSTLSFETVIKFDGTLDSNDRKVFHWDKTSTTNAVAQIRKGTNNGRLMYQHHNSQWYTLAVDDVVVADTYTHIVVTHENTTAIMYKDGVQVGTTTVGTLDYTNAAEILIGYRANAEYWKGEIPLFRVYNRKLSAGEVEQNFTALRTRFNI